MDAIGTSSQPAMLNLGILMQDLKSIFKFIASELTGDCNCSTGDLLICI